jgi:hypothetical protein
MVDLHHRFFVAIVGVVHHLHLIVLADWDEVHVVLVAELRRQRRRHEDGAREVARGLGAGRREASSGSGGGVRKFGFGGGMRKWWSCAQGRCV